MLTTVTQHLLNVRYRVLEGLKDSASIKSVLAGKADKDIYIKYLTNVYQYAQHSPKVIALAASRCMNTHPQLAKYLLHHAEEEQGHDLWALADLQDLGVNESTVKLAYPVPSCSAMIGFVYYTAGYANPVGLFGWLYVLEAMGNDIGGIIAEQLNDGLSLSNTALRFVAGHGISDRDHTTDLTEVMNTYVKNPQDVADINHVADVIADLYVRMFTEIAKIRV